MPLLRLGFLYFRLSLRDWGVGTDAAVDKVAKVARLLLIQDLRDLQTSIDDALVAVQVCRWL